MATESVTPRVRTRSAPSVRVLIPELLERGGLIILLILLIVFFSVDSKSGTAFTSSANVQNILGNQGITGIIALAMVVPLVSGYFDLSVAAVAGLSNVTTAALIGTHHDAVIVGIIGAMVISAIAGSVNGFLVARMRLNGFVVTLGTYTLIGGLLQYYTKGQTITNGIPTSFSNWGTGKYLGLPRPFWLLMVVALVTWYVLMHTPFGRKLESIGSNESAAHLVGIRVNRAIFLSFLGSSLLAGAAGVLLTATAGSADPTAGPAYLFPSLAAVFLGATAIRPGRYNVWGTIIGVFLVAVAVDGFTLLGASSWVTPVFNGAALVGAVTVSTLIGRRREANARADLLAPSGEGGATPDTTEGGIEREGRISAST
jgi:ribose transport system permease protein